MSSKDLLSDTLPNKVEFTLDHDGKQLKFFAKELTYFETQDIMMRYATGQAYFAHLIAASIEDEEGRRFTYQEVMRMKKEVALVFEEQARAVNKPVDTEKK